MSRMILVSNRLPVTLSHEGGALKVVPSSGGLATGLRGPHQRSDSLWIGWPGETSSSSPRAGEEVAARLAELRAVPVPLTQVQVSRYYHGFSNGVLWPLYHYLIERIPRAPGRDWPVYVEVNKRFAEAVASHYRTGDLVWVHDYQLSLVPGMLRRLIPEARIGFFLHIPFPSSEVFRTLPWRGEILEGMLGADLVGFHTYSYLRHFARSVALVLGPSAKRGRLQYESREVRLGTYPIGVDARDFSDLAARPKLLRAVRSIRKELGGRKLLLGVDRLDYTKGLLRRLAAIEDLLRREPGLRNTFRFVQVAVPSRMKTESYASVRRQLDEIVGRINGEFGGVGSAPVDYLFRSISREELVALYRAADVMVVTPLRDGMNLVAKEFVASRPDEDGVLLLSEFAGAASELVEAVLVNPYDIEGTASAIRAALTMHREERRERMRALRSRVLAYDCYRWAQVFGEDLGEVQPHGSDSPSLSPPEQIGALSMRLRQAEHLILLLDYDGTLVRLAGTPQMARPDPDLMRLLTALSRRRGTDVHVISGRPRPILEEWFGALRVGLHAEHGFWSRMRPGGKWVPALEIPSAWKEVALPVLLRYAEETPGALVEEKSAALAWHFRRSDPEFGTQQAASLVKELGRLLASHPVEVLEGSKVVEVRMRGVHKGVAAGRVLLESPPGALVVAAGDDRTDEDLFASLPTGSVAIHVGPGRSLAKFRLADPDAVRSFLKNVLFGDEDAARPSRVRRRKH